MDIGRGGPALCQSTPPGGDNDYLKELVDNNVRV